MEPIPLGGVTQWIAFLGESPGKPLLLWVHGGPGLAETPWLRRFAGPLTQHFSVVTWDQRGSGKSWASADPSQMTVERLVEDTLELSARLGARASDGRIVLAGHSFGGSVAAIAAGRRPDLYRGLLLVAPLVKGIENDRASFDLAREDARLAGHARAMEQLDRIGPPPWERAEAFARSLTLMGWAEHFSASATGPNAFRSESLGLIDVSPDYGPDDRLRFWSGHEASVTVLYEEMMDVDLEKTVPKLEVPVVAALGRHDHATPSHLAVRWLAFVQAPRKELVWFERSGHNPAFEEPEKFAEAAAMLLRGGPAGEG